MSIRLLRDRLARLGVELTLDGGDLVVDAPESVWSPALRNAVLSHKAALLGFLAAARAVPAGEQRPVFADFETRSPVRLDEVGGRIYASHPATEVLCCVALLPDGTWVDWRGGAPPPGLLTAVEAGLPVAAHNAFGFDKHIWERLCWPTPTSWVDTMQLAALAGLPASLEELGQVLFQRGKDVEGRRLTLKLGRINRCTGTLPEISEDELDRVVAYCRRDVQLVADAWDARLVDVVGTELEVRRVDATINERGFAFDADLAASIIAVEAQLVQDALEHAPVAAAVLCSPIQLREWLAGQGYPVDDVRQDTLETLLRRSDLPANVAAALQARLSATRIAGKKVRVALNRLSSDSRYRDGLRYHAALTGRWGGRGFQPQNLPRGVKKLDIDAAVRAVLSRDLHALHAEAVRTGATELDVLATLVRSCIVAPENKRLAVCDYAQIEARVLLWVAGDEQNLAKFGPGKDPYSEEAAALYRIPYDQVDVEEHRPLGKVTTLGCGYQMGPDRFRSHAESYGIDWRAVPFSPAEVIESWRDRHPKLAGARTGEEYNGRPCRRGGLWRELEDAARAALTTGRVTYTSRCTWGFERGDLVCTLPSGRRMVYRDARLSTVPKPWGGEGQQITYAQHKGRVSTYGGKLTENVVQAVSRDILANALVRLEKSGIPVVLHVHDEVVCEVDTDADLERVRTICEAPISWAEGLPLAADGYVARRYRK